MANLVCFITYVSRDYRINAASICYGHNLAKDSFALFDWYYLFVNFWYAIMYLLIDTVFIKFLD